MGRRLVKVMSWVIGRRWRCSPRCPGRLLGSPRRCGKPCHGAARQQGQRCQHGNTGQDDPLFAFALLFHDSASFFGGHRRLLCQCEKILASACVLRRKTALYRTAPIQNQSARHKVDRFKWHTGLCNGIYCAPMVQWIARMALKRPYLFQTQSSFPLLYHNLEGKYIKIGI